jgi:ribosomal protein S18 acetylase RimI-like enzyme
MVSGKLSILPLPVERFGNAIDVLKNAFRDDPIFGFYFPDSTLRVRVLGIFFSDVIRAHMPFHHVYAAMERDRLVGAAVWRPPNAKVDGIRDRLRGLVTRSRLIALSPRVATKLLRGFAALEATHPRIPHWYLFFVGVDPEQRGRGVGAQLMAPVLRAADAAHVLCYLETPFPQTLPFYRKLGYEVSGEPQPFPGAPHLWAMTRSPRAET